jgi:hypothetical protein
MVSNTLYAEARWRCNLDDGVAIWKGLRYSLVHAKFMREESRVCAVPRKGYGGGRRCACAQTSGNIQRYRKQEL